MLFISAGYETTMNLIPNVVRTLVQHPVQLQLLLDGEVEWAKATEEVLRWDPPAEYVPMRYTTEYMELAGVPVPKGEALLMGYGSSGHDEERHGPTATVFDIRREDTSHLSFSHGPHYCIGANPARTEVNELVPRVFERFPKIRIAVDHADLEPMPSIIISGVKELPVRVDRRVRRAVTRPVTGPLREGRPQDGPGGALARHGGIVGNRPSCDEKPADACQPRAPCGRPSL